VETAVAFQFPMFQFLSSRLIAGNSRQEGLYRHPLPKLTFLATSESLVENLFKISLRSIDLEVVRIMLEAGMNPNGLLFASGGMVMSPLEFVASIHEHGSAF
jgi:hypothetical protein